MELLIIFLVCILSGLLTGLLGIGGGLIIIPLFLFVMPFFGIDLDIHKIIGVSATCVFINSLITVFYRRKEKFLPKKILIKLSASIIFGSLTGAFLSSLAPENIILGIYIAVCLSSIYLMNKNIYYNLKNNKLSILLYLLFLATGAISASIGIGGAVLFATILKCFVEKDTKILLPTITFFVLINALFTFSTKLILGEITLYIIPTAIFASLIGSKIGVLISKKINAKLLNSMFTLLLLLGMAEAIYEIIK